MSSILAQVDILVYTVGFLVSFVASTVLIRRGVPVLQSNSDSKPAEASVGQEDGETPEPEQTPIKSLPESSEDGRVFDPRATGFWIGFCETLLVFVLVSKAEYAALAIIIGAKEFVRKEDIKSHPSYYLLGTLINLSVAVVFALVAGRVVEAIK